MEGQEAESTGVRTTRPKSAEHRPTTSVAEAGDPEPVRRETGPAGSNLAVTTRRPQVL